MRGQSVKDVSFQLHRGEILGFAGLVGAGRTETMRAIFGADKMDSGKVFLNGREIHNEAFTDPSATGLPSLRKTGAPRA